MGATDFLSQGVLFAFGSAFVGGFLTSLTPCVYPLIPITVSLFGARDEAVSRPKAMMLAAAYVCGMGAMYASLGIFSALAGKGFGTQLANAWVVGPIAILFLAMAASMFGAFELNLPPSVAAQLTKVGGKGPGGAFAMGLVGGIIAAPCTGPVLASILAYVATTHSVGLGAGLLFTYAIGMGMLFFFIAAFAVRLPKSGAWMEAVKGVFGVCMIVAALYFLLPILPALGHFASAAQRMLLISSALIATGALLGGIHLSYHYTSPIIWMRKSIGAALIVVGTWQGVLYFLTPKQTQLVWLHDEAGITAARTAGRPTLLDFYADWCVPCKELDRNTFADASVQAELARYSLVKIDNTDGDAPGVEERKERFGAKTLPTVVLIDSQGKIVERVSRVIPPGELVELLRTIH